ncbi:MAG: ABC transporter ATP-binding protein [Alphaproteobacteria bacterium]|nr:ABC transporter ATP-binding protein [Alphaproteobacteria bacterium]
MTDPAPFVRFQRVGKTYDGGASAAVRDLDLDVAPGEFLTLLGPSGSGKTTTLMMLAGFETPSTGAILLEGEDISRRPAHKRGLGMVFQNYALFPHMSVAQNLAFPLQVRRMGRAEIKTRVEKALAMVRLEGFGHRRPAQLSGGQQQRVAVARALVFEPKAVLMDEPLGALDKSLREQLQYEISRIHRELGVTVLYVTHDQSEALTMSDRIAVFNKGRVEQCGTPDALYDQPANLFVAGFVGENNFIAADIGGSDDGHVHATSPAGRMLATPAGVHAGKAVIAVRPERVLLEPAEAPHVTRLAGTVSERYFAGDHVRLVVKLASGEEVAVKASRLDAERLPDPGEDAIIGWRTADAHAFPPDRPGAAAAPPSPKELEPA